MSGKTHRETTISLAHNTLGAELHATHFPLYTYLVIYDSSSSFHRTPVIQRKCFVKISKNKK